MCTFVCVLRSGLVCLLLKGMTFVSGLSGSESRDDSFLEEVVMLAGDTFFPCNSSLEIILSFMELFCVTVSWSCGHDCIQLVVVRAAIVPLTMDLLCALYIEQDETRRSIMRTS